MDQVRYAVREGLKVFVGVWIGVLLTKIFMVDAGRATYLPEMVLQLPYAFDIIVVAATALMIILLPRRGAGA